MDDERELKPIEQVSLMMTKGPPRGGNIILKTGRGVKDRNGHAWPDGAFLFVLADGAEVMRFEPTGEVIVRGQKVDDNVEVYKNFRAWFMHADIKMEP